MKTMKKVLCVLLVVLMCVTSAPIGGFVGLELPEWNWNASAVDEKPTSGQCGDNAYWSFDKNTGTLTISGTGATWNFQSEEYPYISDFMDYYRDEILTLIVEEGITTIGDYFFVDGHLIASGVENIIFPETLTKIGNCAFLYNANLKNIRFEGSLTEIGRMAFSSCYSLKSISGLKNIEKIGASAFSMCISLDTITGLESVKEIGESAFGLCYKLKSINLGSTEKIGNFAFSGCFSLEDVDLSSAKEIGDQAFAMCFSLESIDLPQSLNNLGKEAFLNCIFVEEAVVYNQDIIFNENSLCVTQVVNLDDVSKEELVSIVIDYYDTAFSLLGSEDKSELESIEAEIEKHIIEYEIPQPHGTIVCYEGSTAETYAIENGINYRYFSNEEPERTVVATGKCGDNAYYTLYSDGELVISGEGEMYSRTFMEDYPTQWIDYADEVKSVVIEEGITTVGVDVFKFLSNIETVELPDSLLKINQRAFSECESIVNIIIPDSVILIDDSAFFHCSNLTSVIIGGSVTTIGKDAFACCDELISVDIPDSVTTICEDAFSDCDNLKKLTLGNGVTTIGDQAFIYCVALESVILPNGLITIGEEVFCGCTNLTDVYFNGTKQEWNNIDIGNYNDPLLNATIHFLGEEEEDCTHKETFEQTIPASCTVSGMKFTVCVDCGETIGNPEVIPAAHTPGEWETVIEPTYEAEGKKVKKCTACGETLEEEIIPKLELAVVEDEKTGVGLEFPAENYDGKVEIEVEESFDGTAFNILDTKTGAVQQKIYDIKMLVDGEVTQPNGKITVRIPLPAGYNPKFSFVYYVNTETGAVEKMEATYEDGYMVFETDHFSYYAVIAEPDTDNCSCNCHAGGIKGFFFNFILFFQKIFRTNKVCKCGINHY